MATVISGLEIYFLKHSETGCFNSKHQFLSNKLVATWIRVSYFYLKYLMMEANKGTREDFFHTDYGIRSQIKEFLMAQQTNPAGISASVGQTPSVNKPDDVLRVQQRLNHAGAGIKEDKACGPKTVTAIKEYQRNFLSNPDGRVDPGGLTWKHLVEGKFKIKREPLILLPQMCGLGYYSYSPATHQYGTKFCIQTLRDICTQFQINNKKEIGIGDISFAQGGHMSPHQTHQHGTHVDIRPLRKDDKNLPVTISDPNYSRDLTKLLVQSLLSHRNVKSILFNDTAISGVKSYAGHDNHLHVSMHE
ncbi:MAG TPA: peptidoglycan-binding domain-containing protein [Candidatus Contendobacter sp.]|nr:peptidoglycan-binding domain-containing protein [Candidatus Contendobacter sp.]MDS4057140.1 peptidoglycan-binding domain-containing protein [Candidatus Contendobacter sp.]HRD48052.1 peptidoglycan-binding domain-containing protein [Candidatus Contendobacter sp.]